MRIRYTTRSAVSNFVAIGVLVTIAVLVGAGLILNSGLLTAPPRVFYLNILASEGLGSINPSFTNQMYNVGEVVQVTGIPNPGWELARWILDDSTVENSNSIKITMLSNHALKAVFSETRLIPLNYTMKILTPDGLGSIDPVIGEHVYDKGETVQVTVTPDLGWELESWIIDGDSTASTNPLSVTMDSAHTIKAVFTQVQPPEPLPPPKYALTVSVSNQESGSVSLSPNQASYISGASVQLTAVPAAGWVFSGWSGDLSGSANPATVTMSGNKTVTATFTQDTPPQDVISIGVYLDSACNNVASDLTGGALYPGDVVDQIIYLKNQGTVTATLSCSLTDWNPSQAADYFTISWDREGFALDPGQVIQTTVTLTVHPDITGISTYSFKFIVIGTG